MSRYLIEVIRSTHVFTIIFELPISRISEAGDQVNIDFNPKKSKMAVTYTTGEFSPRVILTEKFYTPDTILKVIDVPEHR